LRFGYVNALWDQNEKTKTPYNIFCLNWLKILLIFWLKLFRCFAYLSFEGHWWLEILVKTDCNRSEAQLKQIVINNEGTNEKTNKRTNVQMYKRTNEQTYKCTNVQTYKQTDDDWPKQLLLLTTSRDLLYWPTLNLSLDWKKFAKWKPNFYKFAKWWQTYKNLTFTNILFVFFVALFKYFKNVNF